MYGLISTFATQKIESKLDTDISHNIVYKELKISYITEIKKVLKVLHSVL